MRENKRFPRMLNITKKLTTICIISFFTVACEEDLPGFKLCYSGDASEYVEIFPNGQDFRSSDYFGTVKKCPNSKTCIELPLVLSVPTISLDDIEKTHTWADGGFEFVAERADTNSFRINVQAPWGDEQYKYSATEGIEERTVRFEDGQFEKWVKCGGRLTINDVAKLARTR